MRARQATHANLGAWSARRQPLDDPVLSMSCDHLQSLWCIFKPRLRPWISAVAIYHAGCNNGIHHLKKRCFYWGLFSFLYLKKQNFKNICQIGKFSKMGACRPSNGACRPSSGRQDLNVKKITFRSWHPGRIKHWNFKIDIKSYKNQKNKTQLFWILWNKIYNFCYIKFFIWSMYLALF